MNEKELINKIKEIIFSVPGEIYKFSAPKDCFDAEWEEASMEEKAFLLVEELFLDLNREELKQKKQRDEYDLEVEIPFGPTFYSVADENMFFEALKSIPSIINIKGKGNGLILYFKTPISSAEKEFLRGVLMRYQVPIPTDMKNLG